MQETEGSPAMPGSLEAVDETRWVHSIEDRRQQRVVRGVENEERGHAPWDVIPHRQQKMWEPAYPRAGAGGYAGYDNSQQGGVADLRRKVPFPSKLLQDQDINMPTFDVRYDPNPSTHRMHFSPDDDDSWSVKWDRFKDPQMAGKMDDARWRIVSRMKQKWHGEEGWKHAKDNLPTVPYYERRGSRGQRHCVGAL